MKRSYLLLEVVLALTLVSCFLIPILKPSLLLFCEKRHYLHTLKYASLQREATASLKEALYLHTYPLETWQQGISLSLSNCEVTVHEVHATVRQPLHRTGSLLQADFTPHHSPPFSRLIFVQGVTQ